MAATAPHAPLRVGIVGCGVISGQYLRSCHAFEALDVVAVADLDLARARRRAEEHGVPRAGPVESLLRDPEVDLVINLTVPRAHAEVSRAALEAGKAVYSEKPLALDRDEGRALVDLAEARDLRIGCAPDTFLGAGLQTCREAIDAGAIGRPLSAHAHMASRGPEAWHPDPAFFYAAGAGPLFDVGPYYVTALVALLGPVASVASLAATGLAERVIGSQPLAGTVIRPEAPTHVVALLQFESGAVATLTTSFDVVATEVPRLEIHGSDGTLSAPDPNTFGGPVRLRTVTDETWRELPLRAGPTEAIRGLGAAEMAEAVREGRPHRADGRLALHVLDAMQTILEAAEARRWLPVASRVERPPALPEGIPVRRAAEARQRGTADA
jgi:predicted dehydrogenase